MSIGCAGDRIRPHSFPLWMNLQRNYALRLAEERHGAEIEREVTPRHVA